MSEATQPPEHSPRNADEAAQHIDRGLRGCKPTWSDAWDLLSSLTEEDLQGLAEEVGVESPESLARDDLLSKTCERLAESAEVQTLSDILGIIDGSSEAERWVEVASHLRWPELSRPGVEAAFRRLVGAGPEPGGIYFTEDYSLAIRGGREIPIRPGRERDILEALAKASRRGLNTEQLKDELGLDSNQRLQVMRFFEVVRDGSTRTSEALELIRDVGNGKFVLSGPVLARPAVE